MPETDSASPDVGLLSQSPLIATKPESGTEQHTPDFTLPVVLNLHDTDSDAAYETGFALLAWLEARNQQKSNAPTLHKAWLALRNKHYPDVPEETLQDDLLRFMQFTQRYLNRVTNSAKDLVDRGNHFINRVPGKNGFDPLIRPLPLSEKADTTQRDRIRRRHRRRSQKHSDLIGLTLYNSFVYLRYRRPTKLELVNLIYDIENTLRFYGQRLTVNSINLERAGISRIIVKFFLDKVEYHTVEGLDAPQLTEVLLANDVDAICMSLLEAGSPDGVYYEMGCLAKVCQGKAGTPQRYHPYDLYLVNTQDMTDAQLAFLTDARNKGTVSSVETIRSYQNQYRFNGELVDTVQKLYVQDGGYKTKEAYGEVKLGVSTMADYFSAFDLLANVYNKKIESYAATLTDKDLFNKKLSELFGAVKMGELVHWIQSYTTYPENEEEDENMVETRGDLPDEFNQGMLDIFSGDDVAYWDVFRKIVETTPFLSHTFVGFLNSQCTQCGYSPDNLPKTDTPEDEKPFINPLAAKTGFTPIDPVMNFFDHTRMLINHLGEMQIAQEVITS